MKFLNLDLSRKVDRLKFIILIMGTGVFVVIVTFGTYKGLNSPNFCTTCHVMAPEYYTWQNSSHSKMATCVDCHINLRFELGFTKGLKELGLDVFSIAKNTTAFAANSYSLPVRMIFSIEDKVCLKCHSEIREVSPSGDLIIPHKIHKKKEVSCVRCHSGIAHGDIAVRKVTITTGLDSWDNFKGKRQMEIQYRRAPMDECMKCHQRRSGPLSCDDCHTTSKKPMSHKKDSFMTKHGKQALTELSSCNLCHGYSGYVSGTDPELDKEESGLTSIKLLLPDKERSQIEIVKYSRDNMFCVRCHSKKPKSHEQSSFINYHAEEGQKKSSSCLTCHSNRPEESNPVTKTTCSSCHPSSHSMYDWRATHPIEVKGRVNQSCFTCHSKNTCTTCHTIVN